MTYGAATNDGVPTQAPQRRAWAPRIAFTLVAAAACAGVLHTQGLSLPQALNLEKIDFSCGFFAEGSKYTTNTTSIEDGGFVVKVGLVHFEGNSMEAPQLDPKPDEVNEFTFKGAKDRLYLKVQPGPDFKGTFDGFQFSGGYPSIPEFLEPIDIGPDRTCVSPTECVGLENEYIDEAICGEGQAPVVSKENMGPDPISGEVYFMCDDFVADCPRNSGTKSIAVAMTTEDGVPMGLLSAYTFKLKNPEICKCNEGKKKSDSASSISAAVGAMVGLLAAAAML